MELVNATRTRLSMTSHRRMVRIAGLPIAMSAVMLGYQPTSTPPGERSGT